MIKNNTPEEISAIGTIDGGVIRLSPVAAAAVDYFNTDLMVAWRRLVGPSICFGLAGYLLFLLLIP